MRNLVLILTLISFNLSFGQKADSTLLQDAIDSFQEKKLTQALSVINELISRKNDLTDFQKGNAYYLKAYILDSENKPLEAINEKDSTIHYLSKSGNLLWLGHAHHLFSQMQLVNGQYEEAVLHAQKSFDNFEKARDTSMMIKSMADRGNVFHDIGEYNRGIKICEEALELFDKTAQKKHDDKARVLLIMAINYDDRGDSPIAVDIYKQIFSFKDSLVDKRSLISSYNNIGNSLLKMNELDEAEKYFLINLEINRKRDYQYGLATVINNLGTVAYKRKQYDKAKNYLNQAEEISFRINDAEKILDVLEQQYLFNEIVGKHKLSKEYLKKYHAVRDSLYDLDKRRQIRTLEVQYETEKKEQKIALQTAELAEKEAVISRNRILLASSFGLVGLLVVIGFLWRNRIRKKQQIALQSQKIASKEAEINAVISSQEKERSRYARDLHDGFGQMISILNMNLQGLGEKPTTEEQHQVYENSKGVIDEMYTELKNICFDLMPQTLIKNGLTNALEEFASRVNAPQKVFLELNVFGLDERLNEVQEISLYRIIQEWVNNILKYSDATKITVQITKDQQDLNLLIEDNGMGFDSNLLKQGKGNGWKNMNTRANLINGEIILETKEGIRGNTFILDAVLEETSKTEELSHKKISI